MLMLYTCTGGSNRYRSGDERLGSHIYCLPAVAVSSALLANQLPPLNVASLEGKERHTRSAFLCGWDGMLSQST